MKLKALLIIIFLCSWDACFGQAPQDGTFYVYDTASLTALTPAPEGYKPFYISHFGRHGARYCTSEYDTLYGIFDKARENDLLTDEGKAFFSRYKTFYGKVSASRGNLTAVGKAQQRDIAARMFSRYPDVFEGPTHVDAVSSESARVIMSMYSFLSSLQEKDGDIEVNADASAKYGWWLQPSISSNPYLIKGSLNPGEPAEKAFRDYFNRTVPWRQIAEKYFTEASALEKELGATPLKFIDALHGLVSGSRCLDSDRDIFNDVFTRDEALKVWRALSARFFIDVARFECSTGKRVNYAAFTLGQIIESADNDITTGSTQLRLRFGHDSGLAPLLALMDINGMGRVASSCEESLDIFPSYLVPMGSSLQLVFYRDDGGDILLKALLNEQETTLPLTPVAGPYYRWSDFKAYFLPLVNSYKRGIINAGPLAVLRGTDWGWHPVSGSKVAAGGASVKVFGSVQNVSLVRFPIWEHTVSVVESHGSEAVVTSTFGEKNKAIAASNGSYFDKQVMPVTFVKDEGRVVNSVTSDGGSRSNGMFRIKDRKGREVDILTVEKDGAASAAKGWREAIVSGPVLLEEGLPVIYENDGTREYRRFYDHRHPRTVIGYTADGWIYLFVVDGRFPSQAEGMTISELQVLCESLGLYEALNLDGGGSSTLWTKDAGVLNHPYDNKLFDHDGQRIVPNAVIVK